MTQTRIIGQTGFQIGDDTVDLAYGFAQWGAYADIHIGPALTLHVNNLTDSSTLRQLAECALQAASWLEAQSAKAGELDAA